MYVAQQFGLVFPTQEIRLTCPGSREGKAQSGRVEARTRASNDAVVSSTLPIIPYGGFSPIRLEGWHLGRCLPAHQPAKACSQHALAPVRFASAVRALRCHLR